MEKEKKSNRIKFHDPQGILVLVAIILLLCIGLILAATRIGELEGTVTNNHIVPKEYNAVYFDMDEKVIVVVLDAKDPNQVKIAHEINNYLATK
jgi:hypothetical protein